MDCLNCNKNCKDFTRTVYGDFLCERALEDYLDTEKGRVEYLIGICHGDYQISNFDADFLIDVAASWKQYRDQFILFKEELKSIEATASALGLL